MMDKKFTKYFSLGLFTLVGLSILSYYNFLLFHTIAEIFSIVIAGCVFIISWNSRRNVEGSAIPLLGIAFLSVAVLDGLHTLSYKGMPFFPEYDANLPTQLWIATRYLEAISLLAFSLLMGRRFSLRLTFLGYAALTATIIILAFSRNFPDCYIEGQGLTAFKICSEYLISFILIGTMAVVYKTREQWDKLIYRLIMFSLTFTILAELAFTFYVDVYDLSNLLGHYFKIISFYLIYKAVVVTGISNPQSILFRRLRESEDRYDSLTKNIQGIAFRGDLDFNLIYIRGQVEKITGYTPDEFEEKRISWKQVMHPDDMKKMRESGAQKDLLTVSGHSINREYRILRKDGQIRWLNETIHNVPDSRGKPVYVEGIMLDITEKKQAEETIARQANILNSLLNAIQESALLVDRDETILHANSTLANRWQMPTKKLIGRKLTDTIPSKATRKKVDMVRQVLTTGNNMQFEETTPEHSMEHRFYPVKDSRSGEVSGVTILGFDITERKRRELELNKLLLSVENSPMSIVITDTEGIIEYVNPAFCAITGYSRDEALGENPRILKSGEHDEQFYQDMWKTIRSGNTWRGEIHNRKKNGDLYWEQAAIAPVQDEKGNIKNYVAVKEDITQKKDLERLKSDVNRIMRHDLKSPLNGIIGLPQIMEQDDNLTEEQVDILRNIEQTGRKMLNMINLSLDMFKMEMGNYEYHPVQVDVLAVLREIIADNQSRIHASGLTVTILIDNNPAGAKDKFLLWSEERLLYNLLSNLFLNAVEASPSNSEISMEINNLDPIILTISNSGAVPPDIKNNFFDKYITHGKKAGTGLGTYSAKLIAHTMHYDIDLQTSEKEDVTSLKIYIPKEKPEWDAG
ncbi:MAG: MASE3 domain-containing protein [Thermodesulfobacteriota bacterium]